MNLVTRLVARVAEKRKLIVVAGDVILDCWIDGRVEQCQDGCPKFVQESVIETPGGAANAKQCLDHWDIKKSLYGYSLYDCPIKYRCVDSTGKLVFRVDDDGDKVRGAGYGWARNVALEMIKHADGVLLSDYDKGFLTPEFIREVAALCRERNVPCVADCKREPELYGGCILKCNALYAIKHFDSIACSEAIYKRVVTQGMSEPWFGGPDPDRMPRVKCVNHIGAGDCFGAHLTLALAYGFSLKESVAIAHSAGRVYVQHPHNRAPYPHEIETDMSSAT